MAITLADAQAKLASALAAEEKILSNNQEYSIGSRHTKRAALKDIRESIEYWNQKCLALETTSTGITVKGVNPSYAR